MNRTLRTLHLDLGQSWRGGQQQALVLLEGIEHRGHEAELVAPSSSALARRAAERGVRVHPVSSHWTRLAALRLLRQLLGAGSYDVIHSHDSHSHTVSWLAGRSSRAAARRPVHLAARRVGFSSPMPLWTRVKYAQGADHILAVSEFVKQTLVAAGVPGTHIDVVYDGVDFPPLLPAGERQQLRHQWGYDSRHIVLGSVGAFEPQKGQELLLRFLPQLVAEFAQCRLLLVGEGPQRPELEALVRRLGMEAYVQFSGFVEDIGRAYQAMDIFLFSAHRDGLGSALLRAMAHGLPVVALKSGAVREIMEAERTGILVDRAEPAPWVEALRPLLRDSHGRGQLGSQAREHIRTHFSADLMIENTLRAYERALRPTPARGMGGA